MGAGRRSKVENPEAGDGGGEENVDAKTRQAGGKGITQEKIKNERRLRKCPGLELNQQGVAPTTTSTLRVCQFRHLGSIFCNQWFQARIEFQMLRAGCDLLAYRLESKSCRFLRQAGETELFAAAGGPAPQLTMASNHCV